MFTWLRSRRRPRVMVAKSTFIVRAGPLGQAVYYVRAGQCVEAKHWLVKSHRRYFKREAR
jgi:hypothetical protein